MEARARAGIDLQGRVMRYAEVEQYGAQYRLLRLGSCEFEFDVAAEVFLSDAPQYLDIVAEAVGDVFSGAAASEVSVVVHPTDALSFFAPLPAGLDAPEQQRRIDRQAALLGAPDARLTVDAVATLTTNGSAVDLRHVLALSEPVHDRLDVILESLPAPARRPMLSMQGVATILQRLDARYGSPSDEAPFTLAVGWYPAHVELTLSRLGQWRHSHHAAAGTPDDAAYFAVALLQQLRVPTAEVGSVLVYGADVDPAAFSGLGAVFGTEPRRLNPVEVVDLDPDSLASSFIAEGYAACIGVAL